MNQSHPASHSRHVHLAIGALSALLATHQLYAQCPDVPTTHPNGAVEGQVNTITGTNKDASVAIDAVGTGRFIIAWKRSSVTGGPVTVLRFDADGTCIPDPAVITPSATASTNLPSMAMSTSGNVSIAWGVGLRDAKGA